MMKERSRGDKAFQWSINIVALLIGLFTLYPLIYVLSASFSSPIHVVSGRVWLFPLEFTANAYRRVLTSSNILIGYRNTLLYACGGTLVNLVLTVMAAYPLSLKDLKGRNLVTFMITFTMFFSGGMIPSYLNVKNLGLLDHPLAVILPAAINATNMLIMRNYFQHSMPGELREAAEMDGSSPLGTLVRIVLPLSKSILVVITIYYLVAHWNSYFDAMLYLRKNNLLPLQVFLRQILLLSQMGDMAETIGVDDTNTMLMYAALKYAIIVVSALPLLILYPMIQRFFEKGIMMGSIKG